MEFELNLWVFLYLSVHSHFSWFNDHGILLDFVVYYFNIVFIIDGCLPFPLELEASDLITTYLKVCFILL